MVVVGLLRLQKSGGDGVSSLVIGIDGTGKRRMANLALVFVNGGLGKVHPLHKHGVKIHLGFDDSRQAVLAGLEAQKLHSLGLVPCRCLLADGA